MAGRYTVSVSGETDMVVTAAFDFLLGWVAASTRRALQTGQTCLATEKHTPNGWNWGFRARTWSRKSIRQLCLPDRCARLARGCLAKSRLGRSKWLDATHCFSAQDYASESQL